MHKEKPKSSNHLIRRAAQLIPISIGFGLFYGYLDVTPQSVQQVMLHIFLIVFACIGLIPLVAPVVGMIIVLGDDIKRVAVREGFLSTRE